MSTEIEQVKERTDLVALIGERVKLTRAGANYKGLCPFHSEKTPSFFVNPAMERYICFGCHETGDCFTFLQKFDNMTFAESLCFLAKKAGITLTSFTPTPEDHKRERILAVLSLAKEYYHFLLTSHPAGEVARAYLKDRGALGETITTFGLGYSLPSWDGLQKFLIGKKGFTTEELLDAGLIIRSERGTYYDRFRGRLMFPLTNSRGGVVGFSGRVLDKETKEAKYINSPETSVYHKSELLFGYSQLHRFITEKNEVVIVEGEFDLLSSYQAHVNNVVAIKGSAISEVQLKLLARHAKHIIFSLDNDKAGMEATKRAITLAREFDVSLRVLQIAGGKDPDEVARANPGEWRQIVKSSITVYDYLINLSFKTHDATSGDGKREITNELIPLIAAIPNAVEQAHYVQKIAKRLGVKEEVFLTEMRRHSLPQALVQAEVKIAEPAAPQSREQVLTEYLLSLLFHLESSDFATRFPRVQGMAQGPLYTKIMAAAAPLAGNFDLHSFAHQLPEEAKQAFAVLYTREDEKLQGMDVLAEFDKTMLELEQMLTKQTRVETAARLTQLEEKSDLSPEEEAEYKQLLSQLRIV